MKIKHVLKNMITKTNAICFLLLSCFFALSNLLSYYVFSFTSDAINEQTSMLISSASKVTDTKTLNIDIIKKGNITKLSELNRVVNYCNDANMYIKAADSYSFRTVFGGTDRVQLFIEEFGNKSITSLLHVSSGKPHMNPKTKKYIHNDYELELKFDSEHGNYSNSTKTTYFCIRQDDADLIIGKDNPTDDDYLELIHNTVLHVTMILDNENHSFEATISNIICRSQYDDSYYSNLFGTYITACTFYQSCFPVFDGYSINFDFGSSIYDAVRYLNVIKSEFPDSNYYGKIRLNNISKVSHDFIKKIDYIEKNIYSAGHIDTIACIFICIAMHIIFLVFSYLTLVFFKKLSKKRFIYMSSVFAFTIVYIILYILYSNEKLMVPLFVSSSIITNFLCVFVFVIVGLIILRINSGALIKNYSVLDV